MNIGRRLKLLAIIILSLVSFSQAFAGADGVTRILIFSAPFGSGHDAAAKRIAETIQDDYRARGLKVEVVIKNTLDFAPPRLTKLTMTGFSTLQAQYPLLYTKLFANYLHRAEKSEHAGKMPLFKQLMINTQALQNFAVGGAFVDANGQSVEPDAIFSTWPGSSEALLYLQKRGFKMSFYEVLSRMITAIPATLTRNINAAFQLIPIAHVQTDNAKDDTYFKLFARDRNGNKAADVVFVPSKPVYDQYISEGMKNVVFTGMPLILKSTELPSLEEREQEKKQARAQLGLDPYRKTIMIEAGKNGATNYPVAIASILKMNPDMNLNIIAACGDNPENIVKVEALVKGTPRSDPNFAKLYNDMKELVTPITIRNFMKNGFKIFSMEPLMTKAELVSLIESGIGSDVRVLAKGFEPLGPLRAAADVVITKPGGLSTAELGADGRPMVILQEYASGEALPNGPMFEELNLAVINDNITQVGVDVSDLLADDEKLQSMYASSAEFRRQFNLSRVLPFVDQSSKRFGISCSALMSSSD